MRGSRGLDEGTEFVSADGRELSIADNPNLFLALGSNHGGDGSTTFRIPDLRRQTVKGGGDSSTIGTLAGSTTATLTEANLPSHDHLLDGKSTTVTGGGEAFSIEQPSVQLKYNINTQGVFPGGYVTGETIAVVTMTANTLDNNPSQMEADGRLLSIAENDALFSLIGTIYGGDGRTTFALPDTTDRIVTHEGNGPGLPGTRLLGQTSGTDEHTLTFQQMPNHGHSLETDISSEIGASLGVPLRQPEVTLNWKVSIFGVFPGSADSFINTFEPILGEMALFASNFAPEGWAFADGQILEI